MGLFGYEIIRDNSKELPSISDGFVLGSFPLKDLLQTKTTFASWKLNLAPFASLKLAEWTRFTHKSRSTLHPGWNPASRLLKGQTEATPSTPSWPANGMKGHLWGFPKIGVPQNGWFIMENPIKMDDLGVPLFLETPIYRSTKISFFHDYCGCFEGLHAVFPNPRLLKHRDHWS